MHLVKSAATRPLVTAVRRAEGPARPARASLCPAMKAKSAGFTLVEVLFTVVILTVLLALGVPSLRDFFRNARMTSAANELLSDINIARTEAIKRRAVVTVCASTDPLAATPVCAATDATSFAGWLAFVDDADPAVAHANDGNAVIDSGETILRRHQLLPTGTTAKSDTGFVSFADTGFMRPVGTVPSATRVVICDERRNVAVGSDRSAARAVTISPTGRAGVTRVVSAISGLGGC